MKKLKKYLKLHIMIPLVGIFGLVGLMFYLSSQNGMQSRRLSRGILKAFSNLTVPDSVKNSFQKVINADFLFRKTAHFFEYFILALLIYFLLRGLKVSIRKSRIITMIGCGLFAITDELHQVFVNGRSALAMDLIIDIIGSISAMILIYFVTNRKRAVATLPKNISK